jgi:protein-S-isoprenylcysteine O-methyltransferase Ste14
MMILSPRHSPRTRGASFLAYAWHCQTALLVNIAAVRLGLWSFAADKHLFHGVPIELIFGQAILLGPVNVLLLRRVATRLALAVGALVAIYNASAIVLAQPSVWWGIAGLAAVAAWPSLKLAEWTMTDRRVVARSLLQSIAWVCLLFWLFPSIIFANTGQSWQPFLGRPICLNALLLAPMLLPAGIIFSALRQFAIEGDGTGFPYDPPKRLVTGGVYAYVSNPMQLGICLAMAWWGVVTASIAIALASVVALMLFLVFKDVCNGSCAIGERDPNWARYQREVPKWFPRRRAWVLPASSRGRPGGDWAAW